MSKSFTRLPKEGAHQSMSVANSIYTQDATGTPQTSPLAITVNLTTLAIPTNAAEIVLKSSVALKVSDDATMARYYVLDADTPQVFPLGDSDYLYVAAETTSGTLNFYFHLV